ncbi:exodeoxyribonuclease III (xth) [Anaerohalosphaera lusitana]|uniref:Exodeoxyribonuclease III (Xth) n=1 Tax=Anaerohalosphaera lusitana TaxID=1936003 RepID=A0A1U9NI75_9BACT|nr:endonuclease/exonuclease/phosphatase family protein [Anaerohalosphaera lusitana]AQT67629.1 exodeoxyribonuclease III (xth) [Anaerohalosphaera lusitana]
MAGLTKRVFLVAGILAVGLLGGCAVPGNGDSKSVRVMTYNIHHGEGADGVLDMDRIAEVIEASGADVVGLQEVDNNFGARSEFVDQAKYLAEKLGMYYAYGPAIRYGGKDGERLYGNALLSRYPIAGTENHLLAKFEGHEQRACLKARVELAGDTYAVLVTHLDHKSAELRDEQAKGLIEIVGEQPERTILMGDFNCPPPGTEAGDKQSVNAVARIIKTLDPACSIGGGPAEATVGSGVKIDYIFVSDDIASNVVDCGPVRNDVTAKASDHLPVVAELKL